MPGILPMKIIKIGSSSQSRVAQACDRCRSKKIRCDGVTPTCTQCANVGFECKTSDKLSRRAFPRGYTESLEERVRQLELEVRELKALLDEKDDKIDLLSKFHSFGARRRSDTTTTAKPPVKDGEAASTESDDTFVVRQPTTLIRVSSRQEPHYAGASSSISFLDAFREKAGATGHNVPTILPRNLFGNVHNKCSVGGHARRPPRLVSDRLVNVFFQEFAPLLPVLCRPAFLQWYRAFAEGVDNIENHHAVAQLNLVFSIAAETCDFGKEHVAAFDNHWQSALDAIVHDPSLTTLQCLVLAQMCCLCKGDNNRLLYYAGISIIMSRRLGLHQTQAGFGLDTLNTEMRKRAFWCLYTLDNFMAAGLGLPRLMKDEVVWTELPINVDDEDLFEQRINSTAPETKMSAALSLFHLSRIFARVIDTIYQVPTSSGVPLHTVSQLSEDLDEWRESLAPHLRLVFAQDRPSTRITGDRSPLLSLAYYHVRSLLHRPLATSELGDKVLPSVVALAECSKHIVQIVQLLDERRMSFTLPLSRNEVLVNAGLGLLYQELTLHDNKSSLVNDSQRLVCAIMNMFEISAAPCAKDFKSLIFSVIDLDALCRFTSYDSVSPRSSISRMSPHRSPSFETATSVPRPLSNSSTQSIPPPTSTQRHSMLPSSRPHTHDRTAMLMQQAFLSKGVLSHMRSEPSLRKAAHKTLLPLDKRNNCHSQSHHFNNLDYLPLGAGTIQGNDASRVPGVTPVTSHANHCNQKRPPKNDLGHLDQLLGSLHGAPPNFNNDASQHSPSLNQMWSSSDGAAAAAAAASAAGLDPSMHLALNLDGTWHDPSMWGTETTSVPSVFDDSGASFTSGEDARSSLDLGGGSSAALTGGKESALNFLATAGMERYGGLEDEWGGLQAVDVGLEI